VLDSIRRRTGSTELSVRTRRVDQEEPGLKPSEHCRGAFVGAIDAGTTGVRFVLFDEKARTVASAYREAPVDTPQPGWVEQDPNLILDATLKVVRDVLARSESYARSLSAIGLTNQRETVIAWDRETGRPLYPAIVWQDRRTAQRCGELSGSDAACVIADRTGLRPDPYFSATKIEWLLRNVPALLQRAAEGSALLGTVDAWLLWHLTGEHATDDTNASRTMLFDIDRRKWDDDLLSLFGVPKPCLPQVRPSLSVFGRIRPGIGPGGVPVAGVLGDQQAALFGQGITAEGKAQVTWGTGAFLLMSTGRHRARSRSGLLSTIAYTAADQETSYAVEGSVFVAGAAVQWLRDAMGLLADAADSQALAESVESTGGVVFVPALAGLGAPHWDANARGLIVGITRGTRPAHLVRAGLESIAYQTHDVVRAMEHDVGYPVEELRVGGGAARNDFLCQFQSDILGVPVIRPKNLETTSLGAAYAAGIAFGLWEDTDTVGEMWEAERRFLPNMPSETRDELLDNWTRAVGRSKGWSEAHDAAD
jgi:glycerol kinase